jgi:hypothetical protein
MVAILAKAGWLDYNPTSSGRSAVRLARTVRVREVPSSNLGAPTLLVSTKNLLIIFYLEISI